VELASKQKQKRQRLELRWQTAMVSSGYGAQHPVARLQWLAGAGRTTLGTVVFLAGRWQCTTHHSLAARLAAARARLHHAQRQRAVWRATHRRQSLCGEAQQALVEQGAVARACSFRQTATSEARLGNSML
jgi:hypothetical protein